MKQKLVESKVRFDADTHTYYYGDTTLPGITKQILSRYLFPDKYDGVSEDVLKKAAARGSDIHHRIECIVNGCSPHVEGEEPVEIAAYKNLVKENKLKMIRSEYLVSDNFWVASSIDLVDNKLNLYDIKTTSTLDTEYVRWQLSIYAYLFELQNAELGLKAGKLFALHLKGDAAKLVEVERIDYHIIENLISAFSMDEDTFDNPFNTIGEDEDELMAELKEISEQKKQVETREKALKEEIERRLRERGSYSVIRDGWKITRSRDTTGLKFDEKAFMADKPKMWEKYCKESTTKGRLTITFAKSK